MRQPSDIGFGRNSPVMWRRDVHLYNRRQRALPDSVRGTDAKIELNLERVYFIVGHDRSTFVVLCDGAWFTLRSDHMLPSNVKKDNEPPPQFRFYGPT